MGVVPLACWLEVSVATYSMISTLEHTRRDGGRELVPDVMWRKAECVGDRQSLSHRSRCD